MMLAQANEARNPQLTRKYKRSLQACLVVSRNLVPPFYKKKLNNYGQPLILMGFAKQS